MSDQKQYKVCIKCFTFNHRPYIEEAMDGFSKQKTDFPFVALIVDDASTDGEQIVIKDYLNEWFDMESARIEDREYAEVIVARHKTNPTCVFAVMLMKYNHYGTKELKRKKTSYISEWISDAEFIAMCEGDDYWTDERKLQKQVSFLEAHPDYSFCCHRFKIFDQKKAAYLKEYGAGYYSPGQDLEIDKKIFTEVWVTQILTTMIPIAFYDALEPYRIQYKSFRDVHIYYYLLKMGRGISLNDEMGVYRWHEGGLASSTSGEQRFRKQYATYRELLQNNPDDEFLKEKVRYNIVRLLRHLSVSKENKSLFKEAMDLSKGWKAHMDVIISYLVPTSLLDRMEKKYRKKYLSKQILG